MAETKAASDTVAALLLLAFWAEMKHAEHVNRHSDRLDSRAVAAADLVSLLTWMS